VSPDLLKGSDRIKDCFNQLAKNSRILASLFSLFILKLQAVEGSISTSLFKGAMERTKRSYLNWNPNYVAFLSENVKKAFVPA
jgi:hypothetical protein